MFRYNSADEYRGRIYGVVRPDKETSEQFIRVYNSGSLHPPAPPSFDDYFNGINGICTDGTYLYICDTVNNRVEKRLCSNLSCVDRVGSLGSGNNNFSFPWGIATDNTYLYITDANNNRVVKRLCSNLSYVSQIGTLGEGNDQFNFPTDICVAGGFFSVIDEANCRIHHRALADLSMLSIFDLSDDGMSTPRGLAMGYVGLTLYYYVGDSDVGEVFKFKSYPEAETLDGINEDVNGYPRMMDGTYVYVWNRDSAPPATDAIFLLDPDDITAIIDSFGTIGTGDDQEYAFVSNMCFSGDYMFLTDNETNDRLIKQYSSWPYSYVSKIGSHGVV